MENDDLSPEEALAAIRRSRAALRGHFDVPWTYDLVYGLACGGIVAAQALPSPISLAALFVCIGALIWMMRAWQAHTGFWVNGYGPRNARWVAIGLALILMILAFAGMYARMVHGLWQIPLVGGMAGGILAIIGSRLWMRAYRRDLERDG